MLHTANSATGNIPVYVVPGKDFLIRKQQV